MRWNSGKSITGILASGFLFRIILIWAGWCDGSIVADDAYYYFTISRNVVSGLGVSFDTLGPTNGFHPLYVLLLTPLAALTTALSSNPWVLVHLALTLCAALDLLTGIVLARILSRLASPGVTLWGTAGWMYGPWRVLITLRGLEGSLSVFLLVLWMYQVSRQGSEDLFSGRSLCYLGLIYGGAFLARTDNVLLVGAGLLAQAGVLKKETPQGVHHWARSVTIVLGTALVIVSPWLIWNSVQFGTVVQTSALIKAENAHIYGTLADTRYSGLMGLLKQLTAGIWVPVRYIAGEEFRVSSVTWVLLGLGFFVDGIALWEIWRRRHGLSRGLVLLGSGVCAYMLVHMLLYGIILRSYATWYASFST